MSRVGGGPSAVTAECIREETLGGLASGYDASFCRRDPDALRWERSREHCRGGLMVPAHGGSLAGSGLTAPRPGDTSQGQA